MNSTAREINGRTARDNFTILPNTLKGRLDAYQIAVVYVLKSYFPNVWPSYKTIASDAGLSRAKVVNVINELVEKGLVTKKARYTESGDATSNEYELRLWDAEGRPWTGNEAMGDYLNSYTASRGGLSHGLGGTPDGLGGGLRGGHEEEQLLKKKPPYPVPAELNKAPKGADLPDGWKKLTPDHWQEFGSEASDLLTQWWNKHRHRAGKRTERAFRVQVTYCHQVLERAGTAGLVALVQAAIDAAQMGPGWQAIKPEYLNAEILKAAKGSHLGQESHSASQETIDCLALAKAHPEVFATAALEGNAVQLTYTEAVQTAKSAYRGHVAKLNQLSAVQADIDALAPLLAAKRAEAALPF